MIPTTIDIGITQCDCERHQGQWLVVARANLMGLVEATHLLQTFPTHERAVRYAESEQAVHDAKEWVTDPDGPVAEALLMLSAAGFGGVPLRGIEGLIEPPSAN